MAATRLAVLRAILLLPGNVLGVIPALLLWWSGDWRAPRVDSPAFWLACLCLAIGLTLMATTIRLLAREGDGTLAPWNPTEKLVVSGPYRHVRNPMISGVLFNLAGEALLFRSVTLAAWFALFFVVNAVYIPLAEEPGLERRFGEDYRRYKAGVARWLPSLRPWRG